MQNHSRTSEVKGCGPILEHEISYIGSLKLGFTIHWGKNDFLQPSDRQNFANALGQNCIHDLRLRRMHRGGDLLRFVPNIKNGVEIKFHCDSDSLRQMWLIGIGH